jgi:hypothetical protein
MAHGQDYSGAELKAMAAQFGLSYTPDEFAMLRDALLTDGFLEQT